MKRHKKDCQDDCTKCKPVDPETYAGYSEKQKNNETEKSKCRGQSTVDRVTGDIPEGHSTVIMEWHNG